VISSRRRTGPATDGSEFDRERDAVAVSLDDLVNEPPRALKATERAIDVAEDSSLATGPTRVARCG